MKSDFGVLVCLMILVAVSAPASGDLVGTTAPPLHVLQWVKGGPTDDILDGEYIYVVEFWATWCVPCLAVFPLLNNLQEMYEGTVLIVALSNEDAATVVSFVATNDDIMRYTVGVDDNNQTFNAYEVDYIPRAFIINREGTIIWNGHSADLPGPLAQAVADDPALRFTKQPLGAWAEEGESHTFEVETAGGEGDLTYTWYKDGIEMGDDSPTYTIESLMLAHSGTYYCVVTDEEGPKASITSHHVQLRVFEEGSLPAAGALGLLALATALTFAAARAVRKQ